MTNQKKSQLIWCCVMVVIIIFGVIRRIAYNKEMKEFHELIPVKIIECSSSGRSLYLKYRFYKNEKAYTSTRNISWDVGRDYRAGKIQNLWAVVAKDPNTSQLILYESDFDEHYIKPAELEGKDIFYYKGD